MGERRGRECFTLDCDGHISFVEFINQTSESARCRDGS